MSEELTRTQDLMDADLWPYRIEANRAAIESLTHYAHAQGLMQR
jgi:4,5-dihydroxyphthalate decarboxylase